MLHTVILDTNPIFGDPKLRSGALNQLVRSCCAVGVTVMLPDIVVLEIVAQYEPQMRARLDSASTAIKSLDQYIYTGDLATLNIDIQSLGKGYEEWLRNRLIDLGIVILKLPEIPQKTIMERALKKRRPFTTPRKGGDPGYKDTLIWETILDFLDSSLGDVVLVTNDTGFYHGTGSQIHGDLEVDLKSRGHSIDKVTLQRSYDDAIEFLKEMYDFPTALQEEEWAQVSKEDLELEIPFAHLLNQQKSSIQSELASDTNLDELRIYWEVEPDKVDFDPEYIGNGEWKISGTAYWETEVEYYDFDLPQFMAEKSGWMELEISFTIYYDHKDKEVDHETIINSVTRMTDPVGSQRPEELTTF